MSRFNIDINSVSSRLFEATKYELQTTCVGYAQRYRDLVESEIELMMLCGFELQNLFYTNSGKPFCKIVMPGDFWDGEEAYLIVRPQFQWEKYRIDFRVDVNNLGYPVFIECDGHNFHERTKEQAERDRARDRAIQAANIPIMRFTGREIYRDPMDCINQVCKFVVDRFNSKPA